MRQTPSPESKNTLTEDSPSSRQITMPIGRPEFTLGYGVAKWVSTHLKQPNGPRAGKPFAFVGSQLHFLAWWYAVDENGRFIYQRAGRRLPKGSGKSPFAAMLAVAELLGPVRFDRFDPNVLGGVRGKPVTMPWVQIVATSEAQTENTMRVVRAVTGRGSAVKERYALDVGKQMIFVPPEGKLQVVTSSAATLEGAEATFVIADETEHWTPNNGGPELLHTVADNVTKSGSRFIETCNAWRPGVESVAEKTYDAWLAQEEGRTLSAVDEKLGKILYDARIARPDVKLEDPEELREQLEFVYGDCSWADIQSIMGRIYDPTSNPDDSRRKYLNQPVSRGDAWCTWQEWHSIKDTAKKVLPGEAIALGFDGSLTNDATALIGCRISDGHTFNIRTWEPRKDKKQGPSAGVSVEVVDAVLSNVFDTYDVKAFFGDVAYWESYIKVTWPEKFGKLVDKAAWARHGDLDPQPFAYDLRGNQREWIAQCELVRNEIAEEIFTHDDDPILSRHILNAVNHETRWGLGLRKRTPNSPDKIDAAVAMILARLARSRYLAAESKIKKRTGKVWA
jgi:hypothetical protein